jgi:hypothetical protein
VGQLIGLTTRLISDAMVKYTASLHGILSSVVSIGRRVDRGERSRI